MTPDAPRPGPARAPSPDTPPTDTPPRPPRVAVMIGLHRHAGAGGHVKCWERFAEAAVQRPDAVDLTVIHLGDRDETVPLSDRVRFRSLPPQLDTRRHRWLSSGAGDTDLAGRHRGLERLLGGFDILHITDTFAFARSARRHGQATGTPLVYSIHTDLPRFTRIYSREILGRMLPGALLRGMVLDRLALPDRLAARNRATVEGFIGAADHVLVSKEEDRAMALQRTAPQAVSWLRRGVDTTRFHPDRRDRAALARHHGVPEDAVVLLFVGRVDASKNALTAARAARLLVDRGLPVHLVVAGDGAQRTEIQALLGDRVTAPGSVPQDALGALYAGADLFVFPSETEVSANVVNEARAAGLPPVVAAADSSATAVRMPGTDGLVVAGQDPAVWADALASLVRDGARRRAMGARARAGAEADVPSWGDVLEADLLPVWHRLAGHATAWKTTSATPLAPPTRECAA